MTNYTFDFAFLGEQILEPVLRTLSNINLLQVIFEGMRINENELDPTYYDRQKEVANFNSTKLQFEYSLNKEFNPSGSTVIFIQNYPNNDLFLYAYNPAEQEYKPLYFIDVLPTALSIPEYTPFGVYTQYEVVKFNGVMYESIDNNPPFNSIFNTTYWRRANYGFNVVDIISLYDFIVWVPIGLYSPDFDLKLKNFVNQVKLFNVSYVVQYY